jgi:hypothetical protein
MGMLQTLARSSKIAVLTGHGCCETWMLGILGLQWLIWDTLKSSSIQPSPALPMTRLAYLEIGTAESFTQLSHLLRWTGLGLQQFDAICPFT